MFYKQEWEKILQNGYLNTIIVNVLPIAKIGIFLKIHNLNTIIVNVLLFGQLEGANVHIHLNTIIVNVLLFYEWNEKRISKFKYYNS